jgi:hypothetical protein
MDAPCIAVLAGVIHQFCPYHPDIRENAGVIEEENYAWVLPSGLQLLSVAIPL